MRFMRVGPVGAERPVLAGPDGRHYDLSGVTADIDAAFLAGAPGSSGTGESSGVAGASGTGESSGVDRVRAALAAGDLPETDIAGLRVGPPVARPGVVLCVGMNYAAHAAETGAAPPAEPVIFYKAPNTVVGPYDEVRIPRGSSRTDWEVELGVVIGRTARYLASPADALDHVAGYVLANDISEREFQIDRSGGQWSKGKSCETFNPLGPWLVTADEVGDPQDLALRSWVNGEPRQDSSTKDMVFGVAHLVWYLSQFTVLDPGDLLNTGTPQGVALSGRFPYLAAGDVVEVAAAGLGRQRNAVV